MNGFKIAIATKDKEREDLILMGTDADPKYDPDVHDKSTQTSIIDSVDIFFNTIDNNAKNKSSGMQAKIEIKGKIPGSPELMRTFQKLSEWARDDTYDTQNRNICIGIKANNDRFQVVYSIKNVFVFNYREIYSKANDDRFELYLTQEEGNMDKIEIFKDWPSEWDWARKG